MPRNMVNEPHPSPDPDQPQASGSHPAPEECAAPGHGPAPRDEPGSEGPAYDSFLDELNVILSHSMRQPAPDPILEPPPVAGPAARPGRKEPHLPSHPGRGKPPRTSEIFRAVGPQIVGATGPAAPSAAPGDPASTPRPATGDQPARAAPIDDSLGADFPVVDCERRAPDRESEEEDHPCEPRISWSSLLLMSYGSAITLALAWILWTGRGSRIAAPTPSDTNPAVVDPSRPTATADPARSPPPIPLENLATLGQAIRLGDLEILPLAVVAAPVELVRSIQPSEYRREDDSLVLQLKITNVSNVHTFAPLDASLVRERGVPSQEPDIRTSDGSRIRLFPLAVESEWSILGQEFSVLQPGDTQETLVAAEPGSAAHLAAEMTWRVRLRTGVYRTDMLGVRFTKDEVRHPARSVESQEESSP